MALAFLLPEQQEHCSPWQQAYLFSSRGELTQPVFFTSLLVSPFPVLEGIGELADFILLHPGRLGCQNSLGKGCGHSSSRSSRRSSIGGPFAVWMAGQMLEAIQFHCAKTGNSYTAGLISLPRPKPGWPQWGNSAEVFPKLSAHRESSGGHSSQSASAAILLLPVPRIMICDGIILYPFYK